MVIDNTTKYDEIWNSVYSKLSFSPSCEYRGHSLNVALPFHINENYSVYAIEDMTDYQLDMLSDTMRKIFIKITKEGQKIYALDWQHSSFLSSRIMKYKYLKRIFNYISLLFGRPNPS